MILDYCMPLSSWAGHICGFSFTSCDFGVTVLVNFP